MSAASRWWHGAGVPPAYGTAARHGRALRRRGGQTARAALTTTVLAKTSWNPRFVGLLAVV